MKTRLITVAVLMLVWGSISFAQTETPTPTNIPTDTPTAVPATNTPTPTVPTSTPTVTASPTAAATSTSVPTATPTAPCNTAKANTTVTVGTASTYAVAPNADRYYLSLTNGGNETVWGSLGDTAVVGTGFAIAQGATVVFAGDTLWKGSVFLISAGGSDSVGIVSR